MTQVQQIQKHLEKYGSITAREAMLMYGIYRLAARSMEMGLKSTMIYQDKKKWAEYT